MKTARIVQQADRLLRLHGVRDGRALAEALGVEILPCAFRHQKGAYKIVLRSPFIFLKDDLDPVTENIVLLHELGHHCLHRQAALRRGGFAEFSLFDMDADRMEYEANVFASQLALPDEEVLEYARQGCDLRQIAAAMASDVNLVALKIDTLICQGVRLRRQEHSSAFLKYDKPAPSC